MAVADQDERVLRYEVRAVNLVAARLVAVAAAMGMGVPLGWALWPL